MQKRVVITGLGPVTSIGIGRDAFWNNLINGKSGISEVSSFDTSDLPVHLGGEVKGFRPEEFVSSENADTLGRSSLFAIAAAKLAFQDARINLGKTGNQKIGICLGTTMGESQVLEKLNSAWIKQGIEAVEASLIKRYPCSVLAAHVAEELKLGGQQWVIPTACAAGNYAVGYAYDLIRSGRQEAMLAGGSDAFSRIAFIGFNRLLAIAPEKCQPFDKNRKGMMVGEGSGVVVLESLEKALERKAEIYAEVLGYGLSCDAFHMTAPQAEGIARALRKALSASKAAPQEVDYYNAHGTATPANDKQECLALQMVFGSCLKKLCVSSIKSMLGHTMGAASAIEAIACCLAVKFDIIPPTINYETPDPECDIDCVPNIARRRTVNIALNHASAFGGNNATLVLKKFLPD
jgi:3-oxoacyl-[acyl-carrier-protein] synthase II